MNIMNLLLGENFISLYTSGKIADRLIKKGSPYLLQQSFPELKNSYTSPLFMQEIPNLLSTGVLSVLFLIIYVFGAGGILTNFNLTPPVYVSLFFGPVIIISVVMASMFWAIGRGYLWALTVILYLYLLGVGISLISLLITFVCLSESKHIFNNIKYIPIQIITLYIIRNIINGESFSTAILYFRERRIAFESRKTR